MAEEAKPRRTGKQDTAMPDVAKHHTEQEGECDSGIDCWVDFFIRGNTIRVNNFLVDLGKFICLEVSGRVQFSKLYLFDLNP